MKVAGIDIGSYTAKAVILKNDNIYFSVHPINDSWRVEAETILNIVLDKAGLARKDLDAVVATGLIGDDWEGADDWLSEVSCSANGALYYFPSARTVIDIGAESCRVNKCDETGIITDYKVNQKCGSGSGLFINVAADALGVDVNEVGELALKSQKSIVMNSTCAVFAESELVSLVNQKEKKEDILRGVFDMIAVKTAALARSIKFKEDVVIIGGAAKNVGMVKSLSEALGGKVLVPEEPEIINALGAAIEAREIA